MKQWFMVPLFVLSILLSSACRLYDQSTPNVRVEVTDTILDEEKAIELVRARMNELNDPRYYGSDTTVRVDHLDDNDNFVIQVFNNGQGQSETINWYTVDRHTGELTPMFAEIKGD